MSAISASSIPQPTAAPLTAAITGTSVRKQAAGRRREAGLAVGSLQVGAGRDHHLLDVVARAERRIATGDHQAPGGGGVDGVGELGVGGERQRIARLGPVDRDDPDVVALLVLDLGVHPASLSLARRPGTGRTGRRGRFSFVDHPALT